jgi:hypothetical protein
MWGANAWGYVPYTLLTVATVLPLAAASWWIVERNALRLKKIRVPFPGFALPGTSSGSGGEAGHPHHDGEENRPVPTKGT